MQPAHFAPVHIQNVEHSRHVEKGNVMEGTVYSIDLFACDFTPLTLEGSVFCVQEIYATLSGSGSYH